MLFEATVREIRCDIGESLIWVSLDKTTDVKGGFGLNLTIGKLAEEPTRFAPRKPTKCFSRGPRHVCEEVRHNYATVNKLISTVKKVFLKCPSRINACKEQLPDVPLPSSSSFDGELGWRQYGTLVCT